MNTQLREMTAPEFTQFLDVAVRNFADEKIKNGSWEASSALEQSQTAFRTLLPEGLQTKDHYLRSIERDGQNIGFLWYAIKDEDGERIAFLYEIFVQPEHRGNGAGTDAMQAFLQEAKRHPIQNIWLHVFGHNGGAVRLYQRLGFEITDYSMRYPL